MESKSNFYFNIPYSIGLIYLCKKSYNFLYFLKQYFLTNSKDFLTHYGNDFVLISGSSKGIGKSFAKEFAKRNCNILLTSRNEKDLINTKKEISKINNNIKIEYFSFDFSKLNNQEEIEKLKTILNNYKIGILINNVGAYSGNYLEMMTDQEVINMINVNIISTTILTKICIYEMKKRNFKSLIVTSGSDLTLYTPPFTQVYTGTKSYLKSFMECLRKENKNIDFTYLDFGPVNTSLNIKKIPFKVESDDLAKKCLNQIGNFPYSHGHYKHALKYKFLGNKFIMWLYTENSLKNEFQPK